MKNISSILVTGANGALGRETLLYFAKHGKQVTAACRNAVECDQLGKFSKEQKLDIPLHVADIAKEDETRRLLAQVGKIDAVVNVAGAFEMSRTVDADVKMVSQLFDANFTSNWLLLKHVLPGMMERGFGRVVLVSAAATQGTASGSMGFYIASKNALNAIVQSSASEVAGKDVRINAVMPTIIDTPRNRADMPSADFSKWLTPHKVAEAMAHLLEADAPNGTLVKLG